MNQMSNIFLKYPIVIGAFLLSASVFASECGGGQWITANEVGDLDGACLVGSCNGKQFCVSNGSVNWWSAFTWCKSNGLRLADLKTACAGNVPEGSYCINLKGKLDLSFWTSTSASDEKAYVLGGSGKHVHPCDKKDNFDGRSAKSLRALCME